jgi:hypothetical protein
MHEVPEEGGRVVVLKRYDSVAVRFPKVTWSVLDIMEFNSRRRLLFGRRLIVLVQSDDPQIVFDLLVDNRYVEQGEWLNTSRGL